LYQEPKFLSWFIQKKKKKKERDTLPKEFDEYKRFENHWFRKSLGGMPDLFITSRLAMNMTVGGTDNRESDHCLMTPARHDTFE
jgi:hypothetical protein